MAQPGGLHRDHRPVKGLKLMAPWLIKPDADVDTSPVLDRLNALMGTTYRMSPKIAGQLRARMRDDKMTLDELLHVVNVKVQQWKGCEDMEKFLRPSTLFSPKAVEYAQERLRRDITEEKVVSKEDLSRMWAGMTDKPIITNPEVTLASRLNTCVPLSPRAVLMLAGSRSMRSTRPRKAFPW